MLRMEDTVGFPLGYQSKDCLYRSHSNWIRNWVPNPWQHVCLEEENEIPQTGNSTVVQWIGLHIFTAKGLDSIPGWGTKILQAMPHSTSSPPSPKRIPQIWDSCSKRHMCSYVCSTRMYLYALTFTIAKTWKQPKCLTTEKWIEAMWCVCTQTHTHKHVCI